MRVTLNRLRYCISHRLPEVWLATAYPNPHTVVRCGTQEDSLTKEGAPKAEIPEAVIKSYPEFSPYCKGVRGG